MSSDILAKIMASVNANANAKIEISEKDGKLTIEISSASSENKQFDDDPPTEIDVYGNKIWKNREGEIHRDGDKPAVVCFEGNRIVHFKHDKIHRDGDKPAVYYLKGSCYQEFRKNGMLHRDGNKPAVITKDYYGYWLDDKHILTVNHKDGVVEV